MPERPIPPRVERFVLDALPSVVHLEALLFVRARPNQPLAVDAVAQALFVDDAVAQGTLEDLCRKGLLRRRSIDGPFEYSPASEDVRDAVDQLAEVYRTRLIPLTQFIHKQAESRSMQAFANAFRLRKD